MTATFAIKPGSILANDSFSTAALERFVSHRPTLCRRHACTARARIAVAFLSHLQCRCGKDAGEPDHAGNGGGRSLWWIGTAPSTGDVTIDTNGSTFDTVILLLTRVTRSTRCRRSRALMTVVSSFGVYV